MAQQKESASRPSDMETINNETRQSSDPDQSYQPESGTNRSAQQERIRGQSQTGTERVEQNTNDDVGQASEEA